MKFLYAGLVAMFLCGAAFCFLGEGITFAATTQGAASGNHQGGTIHTSRSKVPPLKDMAGQEVDTEYFKVVIPQGWSMPVPVKNMPNNGITAVFASMKQEPAVSISIMKAPMSAKEVAEQTIANMKKGGMVITPLEEKDGLWHASITAPGPGSLWFGGDDGIVAVTIITGPTVERANELFSAMEMKVKGLFPAKVGNN